MNAGEYGFGWEIGFVASGCGELQADVAAHEDVGRRQAMEDRHWVQNLTAPCEGGQAGYLAIFDGHGGHWTANWLKRSMHQRLLWQKQRLAVS